MLYSMNGRLKIVVPARLALELLFVFTLISCSPRGQVDSPIIIVTIDTLRADHLGLYGYPRDTSPFLDELAKESVVFESIVTSMATTLPAHVSLFSSRYPLQTGVMANGKRFWSAKQGGRGTRLLAQMLKDHDYATAAIVTATPVKKRTGIDVGFDYFSEPYKEKRRADQAIDLALNWIKTEGGERFFVWIHLFDPHWPYNPLEPFRNLFTTDETLIRFLREKRFPDPKNTEVHQKNNLYDGEIRFVDDQIKRLVTTLKEMGLYDELSLVITADHGESLGQHGLDGHGRLFHEQLRIPLIMKFPASLAIEAGRNARLGSIVDILPTLLETHRLPLEQSDRAQLEGINLLAPEAERNFAFAQRSTSSKKRKKIQQFSLQDQDWKFILSTNGQERLFHLQRDPAEYFNVINQYPKEAARLKMELRSKLAKYLREEKGLTVLEEASDRTLTELRSLGYLD